ncbi:hypothetical protein IMCC1933_05790 [Rhodobacteraceae bacterium IMCC1933]|nr:hypothetical protein [Rhodobacteraceae bacterium IMCC1923]MDP4067042.1 hypothetical protein [Rhodobacteraceae bacterium IMCC1933]MDP4071891.1 hypothetical protein [Rhodobacteraceae bacterium IMCC1909]
MKSENKNKLCRSTPAPKTGIVHLGLGAFFRAHSAIYIKEAMAHSGGDWGVVGVSMRSPGVRDKLVKQGRDSTRRPDFSADEYRSLIRTLPSWIDKGREGKSRDMRHLLRDYVLILANTGIRHGTEADNLRWKHITLFEEKGDVFLEMSVRGKTGRRDIICHSGTVNYLKRIQDWCPDVADMSFEDLIKAKIDLPVFRLPDGTSSQNLRQTFKRLMIDTGLLTCPRTGQNRTLYSFRHTYATFALLNDGMDIHTLAIQMGTSIAMIERHYSHLTPRLRKEMLTGKRYELSKEEFDEFTEIQ